jgi:hypothetical protein
MQSKKVNEEEEVQLHSLLLLSALITLQDLVILPPGKKLPVTTE